MGGTGIVRKLNSLGSISIPKEMRERMNLNENESVEIFVGDSGEIILKKYQPGCIFCGEISGTTTHQGKKICQDCLEDIDLEEKRSIEQ